MARTRVTVDRRVYRQVASSAAMAAYLERLAQRGVDHARAIAPEYTGLTWGDDARAGDYKKSLEAKLERSGFGYWSEIAANARYALQVEFGSGRPATSQERPQEGRSPKWRVLGRALDSLRSN